MPIEQKPFVRYNEEKKADSFAIRLNNEERLILEDCKKILQQPKDSTALKQLAWIGAKTLHDPKLMEIVTTITDNKRKNRRIGIIDYEP